MAYVPMNRTRALIICTRPQDYDPARLREAARNLVNRRDAKEEERRLVTEAIESLRSKRGEPLAPDAATPQHEPRAAFGPHGVMLESTQHGACHDRNVLRSSHSSTWMTGVTDGCATLKRTAARP